MSLPRMMPLIRNASSLLLLAALLALAALPTLAEPAAAQEKRAVGDVSVPAGETLPEASTGWGDVTVDREGAVSGDVRSGVGEVEVLGPVSGRVEVGLGGAYIDSRVAGEVKVGQGDVVLGPNAVVEDVVLGNGTLEPHPQASVNGTESLAAASDIRQSLSGGSLLPGFAELLAWALFTLGFAALGIMLTVLAHRPLAAAARSLQEAPGRSLLLGAASLPVVAVLCVLLAITLLGIPALLLLVPAYLTLVVFGVVVVAYSLGRRLLLATGYHRAGEVPAVGLGALLVSAVYLIPLLGAVFLLSISFLGTGAVLNALLTRRKSAGPRLPASS